MSKPIQHDALKALGVKPFDLTDYLQSDGDISEYMSQVLEDGDNEEFIRAIGYVAKARGMTLIAKETGLGRESLYKALSSEGNPSFLTIMKVLKALGIQLHAKSI